MIEDDVQGPGASGQHPPLEAIEAALNRDPDLLILRSEFACVSVTVYDPGGRPRLRLEDLRTNRTIQLDPLELETLAWSSHDDLAPLLDPSHRRWRGSPRPDTVLRTGES